MKNELAMPRGLDEAGSKAHAIVLAFLEKVGLTDTGGGCKFYSPKEWARRGERGGEDGWRSGKLKLVLVHDGGDPHVVFGMALHRDAEALLDDVTAQLEAAGVYPELDDSCSTMFREIPARGPKTQLGRKQDRTPVQPSAARRGPEPAATQATPGSQWQTPPQVSLTSHAFALEVGTQESVAAASSCDTAPSMASRWAPLLGAVDPPHATATATSRPKAVAHRAVTIGYTRKGTELLARSHDALLGARFLTVRLPRG